MSSSWTSRRRQICPSIKYSLSPERYSRRVTSTSRATDSINSLAPFAWPFPFPFPFPCACPFPLPCPFPSAWRSPSAPLLCSPETNAWAAASALRTPVNRRRTSAAAVGLRASLPLKMTSSIRSPRRLLALCSPITHVIASATLLLPQPLGPTMAVTPLSKASSERSENDLKPLICRRSRRMKTPPGMPARWGSDAQFWLGYRTTTDRFAALSPARRCRAAPGLETAVSVARARYCGKRKEQRKPLWSNDLRTALRTVGPDCVVRAFRSAYASMRSRQPLSQREQFLGLAELRQAGLGLRILRKQVPLGLGHAEQGLFDAI